MKLVCKIRMYDLLADGKIQTDLFAQDVDVVVASRPLFDCGAFKVRR